MSIFGFIITGMVFLVGIFQLFFMKQIMFMLEGARPIVVVFGVVAFFATFLFIYFMPSLLLFKYASSIKKLLKSKDASVMEAVLGRQKKFWKYLGIMVLTLLLTYVFFAVSFIYLLPKFTGLKANNKALLNSAPCVSQVKWFVAVINAGIYQISKSETENTNLNKYPSKLDSSHDGPASDSNPFFSEVLIEGISDSNWAKEGNRYTFKCAGKEYVFKYNSSTGEFSEKSD